MITLDNNQRNKIIDMYIETLDLHNKNKVHNIVSIIKEIHNQYNYIFNDSSTLENITNIFFNIIYSKSYYYNTEQNVHPQIINYFDECGDYKTNNKYTIESCLLNVFDFELVTWSLCYAEITMRKNTCKNIEEYNYLYLNYSLQFIFNINNAQDIFKTES